MPSDAARVAADLPHLDDRLVAPETRYEMRDGELIYVSPADDPHATRHARVAAVLDAHVHAAFDVAIDMLTRTSRIDDIAPDVSVFPDGPDPRTGRRRLAHLVFEIVSTQTLENAAEKAQKLASRGVRRAFAIDIEGSRVLEWSPTRADWDVLDPAGSIADPALEVPLPIHSLIHAARNDGTIARALIARNDPVIAATRRRDREEAKAEGRIEGEARGRIEGEVKSLLVLLTARGLVVDDRARQRILGERDPERLERWIARAATCATLEDLFAGD